MMRKVWLDDNRLPPFEYDVWCTNAQDMIRFLSLYWGRIEKISLDHDLGDARNGTGYDVMKFIEAKVYYDSFEPTFQIDIHSENPVGRKNMQAAINSVERRRNVF